jgi:Na+/melibiose symporter-like transporter
MRSIADTKKDSSFKTLFFYALPALPLAMLGLPLYIYLPTFYAADKGLGVAEVGMVLLVARLIDMLLDPVLGRLSDRFFKRETMMALGIGVLLFGFYFLTHPSPQSSWIELFIFSILVYLGWSMITIPYFALSSQIGTTLHSNTLLASSRELFTIFGVLIALILPYLYETADNAHDSLLVLWSVVLISLPLFYLLFRMGLPKVRAKAELLPFKEAILHFLHEVSKVKRLYIAFLINNLANAIPATLFLFYVELVMKRPDLTGILLLVYFASGIVALPFWVWFSKRNSKRKTWMISMSVASLVFVFIPLLDSSDLVWFIVISVISGLSLGADMALPASIQTDIAQTSQDSGNEFSGVLFGLWAMLTKLALALSVGITFGVLGSVGFESNAPTTSSLTVLTLLYGWLPVFLKMFAIGLLLRLNLEPTTDVLDNEMNRHFTTTKKHQISLQ